MNPSKRRLDTLLGHLNGKRVTGVPPVLENTSGNSS